MVDRAAERNTDRAVPGDLNFVDQCVWQLGAAAEAYRELSPMRAEMLAKAKEALAAALERPGVLAAFADTFSHPDMITSPLAAPTTANLERAAGELLGVYKSLLDQDAAFEMHMVADFMHPLQGPTPWDTFFTAPGNPDQALMPLYGCKTPNVLALGPIEGGDQLQSAGGQGLFYPVGGYERFAEATTVVVAQNLADGLAIDAVLKGDESCAVVVASGPDGVLDVCLDMRQSLVSRAAIQEPDEREAPSLIAALAQADGPDSLAVRRMVQEGPENGASIVRPSVAPSQHAASWPQMAPETIREMMSSAEWPSRQKLEIAAEGPDERLDHGSGFRESVRELRASTREAISARTEEAPAQAEKQARTASRRI